MKPPAQSWTLGCLLLVALSTAPGCKKKVPPPPVPDPVPVQTVESKLQITTVSPSSFEQGKPISAKIYGSAFAEGATVKLGSTPASSVSVVDPNTLDIAAPAMSAGTYDVVVTNPDGASATLRQGVRITGPAVADVDCRALKVYFGFDSAGLTPDARRALDGKTSCYQKAAAVRVAGHADERGTTDYNLALGQRRAEAVKQHLTSMGVGTSKVKTVSYGEERPDDRGSNEAAWAKNRRAEVSAE